MRQRIVTRLGSASPLTLAVAAAAVMMLAVGALVAALISLNASHAAESRGSKVASCINDALADRQNVNDSPALIEEADASAAWAQSLVRVVTEPKPTTVPEQAAQLREFIGALHDYATHLAHVETVLHAHQSYRAAHPLGKC